MFCFFFSDAERKLAFLDVEGYDIFGKNSLFVPLIKWEAFYEDVQTIKSAAEVYEQTFNDIMTSVQNNENFQQVNLRYKWGSAGILASVLSREGPAKYK